MYGQKGPEHTEAWGVKACTLAQVKDVAAQYGRLKKYQSKLIGSNSDDGLDHKGLFDLSDSATARTAGIAERLKEKEKERQAEMAAAAEEAKLNKEKKEEKKLAPTVEDDEQDTYEYDNPLKLSE